MSITDHERSTYANANGCADHDTDAECRAYAAGYADTDAQHEHSTIACDKCESVYDAGYSDGLKDGHCCDHGD